MTHNENSGKVGSLADDRGGRSAGDALDLWFPGFYQELRALAHAQRSRFRDPEAPGTTSIVHDACLRLNAAGSAGIVDRARFFALAARAMRSVIIDNARRAHARRHGGGLERAEYSEATLVSTEHCDELLDIDAALDRLESYDSRLAAIVIYRIFGGLTVEETAEALACSPATVKRDWQLARNWLFRELGAGASPEAK